MSAAAVMSRFLALQFGHHLLPHERWFAAVILRRQQTHRTPAILRMEENYGPEGITLWAAAWITIFPAQLLNLFGIACLLGGGGPLSTAGFWFIGVGVFVCWLGAIRAVQGAKAGRTFRNGRPFLRG